jgi:hypothetical protein
MPKTAKRMVAERKLAKTHTGHSQHMCSLVADRKMDRLAELAKGAKYICHICGRASAKPRNVCEPVQI